jgi:hypothetical protein
MDELNLTHRYKDDFTQTEREIVMQRANRAVDRLLAAYAGADTKAVKRSYRQARLAGRWKRNWESYEQRYLVEMVKAVASAQRKRERRGLEI